MNLLFRIYGFILNSLTRLNNKALSVYKTSLIKGKHGKVSGSVTIFNPKQISLGVNSYINSGTYLHAGDNSKIVIGDNCMISYNVHMRTVDHIHDPNDARPMIEQGCIEKDILIGDNVWIGYGAQILPGITIGNLAIMLLLELVLSLLQMLKIILLLVSLHVK